MPALTISQLFGATATLTGGTLTVKLADLAATGLNGASPTPTEVAAALVCHWKLNKPATADTDADIGLTCDQAFKSFLQIGTTPLVVHSFTVNLRSDDTTAGSPDPDTIRG